MQSKRGELVPVAIALADLPGPVQAPHDATPQARHHFTVADQVNQLVAASEADPERGFMARTMALCSLPRTNPGNRKEYKRVNGPFTLGMSAGLDNKLPYGNLPRLLMAWLCTEAVRTQSRVLVLGPSLAKFMKTLGVYSSGGGREQIKLRNQMNRLFGCTVTLIYEDENGRVTVNSLIADSTAFWWNPNRPNHPSLWESKIELSEKFFQEIIRHPVPIDMNALTALKRCSLGLDLYLWLVYRTFPLRAPQRITWRQVYRQFGPGPDQRQANRQELPAKGSPGVEENQDRLDGPELLHGSGRPDPPPLHTGHRAAQSRPATKLISLFPASQRPVTAPEARSEISSLSHSPKAP